MNLEIWSVKTRITPICFCKFSWNRNWWPLNELQHNTLNPQESEVWWTFKDILRSHLSQVQPKNLHCKNNLLDGTTYVGLWDVNSKQSLVSFNGTEIFESREDTPKNLTLKKSYVFFVNLTKKHSNSNNIR